MVYIKFAVYISIQYCDNISKKYKWINGTTYKIKQIVWYIHKKYYKGSIEYTKRIII